MDSEKAASWLNSLSDKEFVDFFYSSIASRHIYPLERGYLDSHLVLANATRDREGSDSFGHWQLQLLCPTSEAWVHDAPICQFGWHCNVETASWAKHSTCPVCGENVYGT